MTIIPRLLALMSILASTQLLAETCNDSPLRIGLFEFPPFYSQATDGQPQGILIDELDEIMTTLDCRWQGQFYPTGRMLEKFINGETDLLMLIKHPMLVERAQYSHYPIGELRLNSYWTGDQSAPASLEQLHGKRVIVIRGYGYGGLFHKLTEPQRRIKLKITNDHSSGLQMLEAEKGDYLLGYQRPAKMALEREPREGIRQRNLKNWDIYFVLSPRYHDKSLLDRLDQILLERQGRS